MQFYTDYTFVMCMYAQIYQELAEFGVPICNYFYENLFNILRFQDQSNMSSFVGKVLLSCQQLWLGAGWNVSRWQTFMPPPADKIPHSMSSYSLLIVYTLF